MMLKTFIAVLFASSALCAGELFVDFNKGKNSQPGTRQAPFKTLNQALRKAVPGDTIYILPSPNPIPVQIYLRDIRGTAEKPITIDGMNNIFVGDKPLDPAQWKMVKPGLFRKKLVTGSNNYRRFYLIFNGKINRMGRIQKSPGATPYKKVKDLAPGEWTVVVGKQVPSKGSHRQFEVEYFVRLPEKATGLADSGVTEPQRQYSDGVCLRGSSKNLIVRNVIVKHFYNDGFNLHGKCENIRFENVAALYCGDDGISAHEACSLSLENAVFIGCSTTICHIQQAVGSHNNIYSEQTVGRELYILSSGRNDITNACFITDSYSGSYWGLPENAAPSKVENICSISNNPKATFLKVGKGSASTTMKNVRLAKFRRHTPDKEIKAVPDNQLKAPIGDMKKKLFALFGGNLEKALQ